MTELPEHRVPREPVCCGEPMVHNSNLGEWECADAYFALLDDGVIADFGRYLVEDYDGLSDYHRERYDHWCASFKPDGKG